MSKQARGRIIRSLSGFYTVTCPDGQVVETKARGIFRKKKLAPLVGDFVEISYTDPKDGMIEQVLPRTNQLVRPPIANMEVGIVVMSAAQPNFSEQLMARFIVSLKAAAIQPIVCVTKLDLLHADQQARLETVIAYYKQMGQPIVGSDRLIKLLVHPQEDLDQEEIAIQDVLRDKHCLFMGQSGVGKTTLLNTLLPGANLKTGAISTALGRGRHTTRHVELFPVGSTWLADTPGFGQIDFQTIEAEELRDYFDDFIPYQDSCRYRMCLHDHEPKCALKQAVDAGEVRLERYQLYLSFLAEIKSRKPSY